MTKIAVKEKKDIESASLLIRYDHCNLKHKNGSMPNLYKHIFPAFVNEAHFHFNNGFNWGNDRIIKENEDIDHLYGTVDDDYENNFDKENDDIFNLIDNMYIEEEEKNDY